MFFGGNSLILNHHEGNFLGGLVAIFCPADFDADGGSGGGTFCLS